MFLFYKRFLTHSNLWSFIPHRVLVIKDGLLFLLLTSEQLTFTFVPSSVRPMGGGATRLYGSVTLSRGPPLPPNLDRDFCQVRLFSVACRLSSAHELGWSVCTSRRGPIHWSCFDSVKRPLETDLLASTGTLHPLVMERTPLAPP